MQKPIINYIHKDRKIEEEYIENFYKIIVLDNGIKIKTPYYGRTNN